MLDIRYLVIGIFLFVVPHHSLMSQTYQVENGCDCKHEDDRTVRFIPNARSIISLKEIEKVCDWKLQGDSSVYKKVYIKDLIFDRGMDEAFFGMKIESFTPLIWSSPTGSLSINLTPCAGIGKPQTIPFDFSLSHDIRKYDRAFEIDSFDFKAGSYFGILMNIAGVPLEDLFIQEILTPENPEEMEYNLVKTNQYILKWNKKFHTTFKPLTNKTRNPEDVFRGYLTILDQRKVDLEKLFIKEFILSTGQAHKVNEREKAKLLSLFQNRLNIYSFDEFFDSFLYPRINSSFADTMDVAFVFPSGILKNVNPKNDTGAVQNICASVHDLRFISGKGFQSNRITFKSKMLRLGDNGQLYFYPGTGKLLTPEVGGGEAGVFYDTLYYLLSKGGPEIEMQNGRLSFEMNDSIHFMELSNIHISNDYFIASFANPFIEVPAEIQEYLKARQAGIFTSFSMNEGPGIFFVNRPLSQIQKIRKKSPIPFFLK